MDKILRSISRFLASLGLGIGLLIVITIVCIYGSFISSAPAYGVDYAREAVFHTPWFLGLLGALAFNLVLCSWEKSYIALTLYKKKNAIANPAFYRKAKHGCAFPWPGRLDAAEAELKSRYTVVHRAGPALYAQKGLLGRCGATIIHIGLLLTMGAGFASVLGEDLGWGVFDSTIMAAEGDETSVYYTRMDRLKEPTADNLRERPLPFTVRVLDFTANFHPGSTVASFYSSLLEIREGAQSIIKEASMTTPVFHRGYKITQNSYAQNERVRRALFRIEDRETGDFDDFDAGPRDPVRVSLSGDRPLYVQFSDTAPGATYAVLDLTGQDIVGQGTVREEGAPRIDPEMERIRRMLEGSAYGFVVAALFPNFEFDDQNRPTTKDDKFENPAVFLSYYKKGEPNGYAWLFLDQGAQAIMGQPHPEVRAQFMAYRAREGVTDGPELLKYEVDIALWDKSTSKPLGIYRVVPGELAEVEGIAPGTIESPAVAMTTGLAPPEPDGTVWPEQTRTIEVASRPVEPASATSPAPAAEDGRFVVTYLGEGTGHVTYLGLMKDPSVPWIYAGILIVVAGTLVAFTIPYREVWLYLDEGEGLLYGATVVRGTAPAAHREFDQTMLRLAQLQPCGDAETTPEPEEQTSGTARGA